MGKIKALAQSFFKWIAEIVLSTWLTTGGLVAVMTWMASWFHAIGPIWSDRAITALITLAIISVPSVIRARLSRKKPPRDSLDNQIAPSSELSALLTKMLCKLEGAQVAPGISIAHSSIKNVTIINQIAPTTSQRGEIDYQANVEIKIVKVMLAAKNATFATMTAIKIPQSASSDVKKIELTSEANVKEPKE